MANLRNRPTWEELRHYNALTNIGGQEFVYIKLIRELVNVILQKGYQASIPTHLANKEFWDIDDYNLLQISEMHLESRNGDPDKLDDDVVKVITSNRAN